MANVVRGSVLAMMFALMVGAVVAYFTPADSATGYSGPAPRAAETLAGR
ncbi:MAG: hypothetical protein KDK07_16600 [Bauldia sp.]|nr:hypothetical protein [Bauldia sp.]